jgi:dihydrolipoamide dehydrogenase
MGFSFDNLTVDYSAAQKRSRSVVKRQTRRVAALMKNCGITVYDGNATFIDSNTVKVESSGKRLQAKHIIIATGARGRQLPGADNDGEKIINFRNALDLTDVPESALIVGSGPIGMEFATLWNRYGTKVTVVEMQERALPLEDEEISLEAQKQYKKDGISIMTGALLDTVQATETKVEVTVKTQDSVNTMSVDKVLVAIGFVPNIDMLDLDKAGVSTVNGGIEVDDQMRTSIPHIYAIGDVTAKMGLAHVASAQAVIAADAIAGRSTAPIN